MIDLITWWIAAFACSWICAEAKISLAFREALDTAKHKKVFGAALLLTFVECPACTSWWLGLFGYLAGVAPFGSWWQAAFFTCGSSLLLAKYVGMLDSDS